MERLWNPSLVLVVFLKEIRQKYLRIILCFCCFESIIKINNKLKIYLNLRIPPVNAL